MTKINLLPWRDELRRERRQRFFIFLGISVFAALLIVVAISSLMSSSIEEQEGRNNFIQSELATLDREIKEVEQLKEKKAELLARMEVIQSLQGNRPVIVRVFDEFVRVLPEGVYFETLKMQGNTIDIKGVSESNNRISRLMRNMDESDWFAGPNLTAVKALVGEKGSSFSMVLKQVAPVKKEVSSE